MGDDLIKGYSYTHFDSTIDEISNIWIVIIFSQWMNYFLTWYIVLECHFTYSRLCALRVDYECSGNTSTTLTYDQQLFTSADLQNTNFENGMFRAPTTGTFAVNFWTKGFTGVNGGHLDLYHNKERIAWDESNKKYDQYKKVKITTNMISTIR